MASVEEIKNALLAEQAKAAEMTDRALQAVDSITNVASFWLGVLGVGVALFALIGWAAVHAGAGRTAKKVADSRMNDYITSDAAKAIIAAAISDEIARQLASRSFVVVQPAEQPAQQEDSSFPKTGGAE